MAIYQMTGVRRGGAALGNVAMRIIVHYIAGHRDPCGGMIKQQFKGLELIPTLTHSTFTNVHYSLYYELYSYFHSLIVIDTNTPDETVNL